MKFALVLLAVFCLIASAMALQSQEALRSEFHGFMNRFNRVYSSAQEMEARFQIFAANMANVEEYNKESKLAKFGVTRFSDWSPKEREAYLGKLPTDRSQARQAAPAKNAKINYTAPFPSFNFREAGTVQPVKDQGQCGSWYVSFNSIPNSSQKSTLIFLFFIAPPFRLLLVLFFSLNVISSDSLIHINIKNPTTLLTFSHFFHIFFLFFPFPLYLLHLFLSLTFSCSIVCLFIIS